MRDKNKLKVTLDALLGENWVNEYAVGKTYMRIWSC